MVFLPGSMVEAELMPVSKRTGFVFVKPGSAVFIM